MKNLNKKTLMSIGIALLIIILGIIVTINILMAKKELDTFKIKDEDIYIYFSEEKFEFNGNVYLDHDNNITNIKVNNKKTKLYSEPIYYKNEKKIIIPVNYSIVSTLDGVQKKVSYYTVLKNIDDDYYLTGRKLDYKISNNFLYDGSDFYIFINNANVKFDNQSIEISPLSYVNYIYDSKELYIYNYELDEVYHYENVNGEVFVINEDFKVNLSADTIVINGKDKLLMKNFNYLKKLK